MPATDHLRPNRTKTDHRGIRHGSCYSPKWRRQTLCLRGDISIESAFSCGSGLHPASILDAAIHNILHIKGNLPDLIPPNPIGSISRCLLVPLDRTHKYSPHKMLDIIRDAPIGQFLRWATNNRILLYSDEQEGFVLPKLVEPLPRHNPNVLTLRYRLPVLRSNRPWLLLLCLISQEIAPAMMTGRSPSS